jgi:hypothetical protein
MSIEKVIYTAGAKAMGGRVGTAKSDDGQIERGQMNNLRG